MKKMMMVLIVLLLSVNIAFACDPGRCDFTYADLGYMQNVVQHIGESQSVAPTYVATGNSEHQEILGSAYGNGISLGDTAYLLDKYDYTNRMIGGSKSEIFGMVESVLEVSAETSERCTVDFYAQSYNTVQNTAVVTPGNKETSMSVQGGALMSGAGAELSGTYELHRVDVNNLSSRDGDIMSSMSRADINSNFSSSRFNHEE